MPHEGVTLILPLLLSLFHTPSSPLDLLKALERGHLARLRLRSPSIDSNCQIHGDGSCLILGKNGKASGNLSAKYFLALWGSQISLKYFRKSGRYSIG